MAWDFVLGQTDKTDSPFPFHVCRVWTWCWLSGPMACSSGLNLWARCCWVPGLRVNPYSTGQICWPMPGDPSPSGTTCSPLGRWIVLWP